MIQILPLTTDKTNNPSHSFLHRVITVDSGSPEQSLNVGSAGDVTITNGSLVVQSVGATNASFHVRSGDNVADWSFTSNAVTGQFSVYNSVSNLSPINVSIAAPTSSLNLNLSTVSSVNPFFSSNGSTYGTYYANNMIYSYWTGQNYWIRASGIMYFGTYEAGNWVDRMCLINNGNFGIGTNSPSTLFHLNGGYTGKITSVTDTYAVLATDHTIVCSKGTNFTITLPTATVGQIFYIKNIGVGIVTIDGAGADTIDGAATLNLSQWAATVIQCSLANTWVIIV